MFWSGLATLRSALVGTEGTIVSFTCHDWHVFGLLYINGGICTWVFPSELAVGGVVPLVGGRWVSRAGRFEHPGDTAAAGENVNARVFLGAFCIFLCAGDLLLFYFLYIYQVYRTMADCFWWGVLC